ncbi:MAG TPA: hypothetical protein VH475_25020 [Tepidisphaeraceae bacterium]|jgi:hypothetical protein
MWEQYRKTLVPSQLFIAAACVTVYFLMGRQWFLVLMLFLVMQFGGIMGAAWATRLKARMTRADEELPLNRRR